jgi:hypothetical protein
MENEVGLRRGDEWGSMEYLNVQLGWNEATARQRRHVETRCQKKYWLHLVSGVAMKEC